MVLLVRHSGPSAFFLLGPNLGYLQSGRLLDGRKATLNPEHHISEILPILRGIGRDSSLFWYPLGAFLVSSYNEDIHSQLWPQEFICNFKGCELLAEKSRLEINTMGSRNVGSRNVGSQVKKPRGLSVCNESCQLKCDLRSGRNSKTRVYSSN